MSADWTEERVAQTIALWREGRSCSQIGDAVGKTRNAVIGKLHRLNIGRREKRPAPAPAPAPKKMRKAAFRRPRPVPPEVIEASERQAAAMTLAVPVDILGLTAATCRWPLWGPMASSGLYCGGPADLQADRPYCDEHTELTHRRST